MHYTKPTPADLKMRYAAFANVSDPTLQYWLTDAERTVDTSWFEADYTVGLMALAAHNMTLSKAAGLVQDASAAIPAGVTSFRSGSFSANVTEAAANRSVSGGYASTSYGQEFAVLLRRNKGMPRLVGYIEPRECGW